MNIRLDPPAAPRGTGEEQLHQLYAYLFRLSEVLSVVLDRPESPETAAADGGTVQAQLANLEETLGEAISKQAEELAAHKNAPVYPVSFG